MKLEYPIWTQHAFKLLIILLTTEALFIAFYYFDFVFSTPSTKYHQLISLDLEANIPSWFSTIQLFMIGLIPLMLAMSRNYQAPPSQGGLTLFGLGFIYLSLDEAASLHEKMTYAFYNNPLVPYFHGVHGIWITIYMGVMLLMLALLWKDLIAIARQFPKESWLFTLGMVVYLSGTGGAETVTFFYIDKTNPFVYLLEVIFEEGLEMAGASIILTSVLLAAIKKSETIKP